ncbi:MAG: hypothetical protein PHN45_00855 [Methylococcales bacterium]|nr:hypothetical protein [Methylococcales bacterium]
MTERTVGVGAVPKMKEPIVHDQDDIYGDPMFEMMDKTPELDEVCRSVDAKESALQRRADMTKDDVKQIENMNKSDLQRKRPYEKDDDHVSFMDDAKDVRKVEKYMRTINEDGGDDIPSIELPTQERVDQPPSKRLACVEDNEKELGKHHDTKKHRKSSRHAEKHVGKHGKHKKEHKHSSSSSSSSVSSSSSSSSSSSLSGVESSKERKEVKPIVCVEKKQTPTRIETKPENAERVLVFRITKADRKANKMKTHHLKLLRKMKKYIPERACGRCSYCKMPPCGECKSCISNKSTTASHKGHKRCANLTCYKFSTGYNADRANVKVTMHYKQVFSQLCQLEIQRVKWAKNVRMCYDDAGNYMFYQNMLKCVENVMKEIIITFIDEIIVDESMRKAISKYPPYFVVSAVRGTAEVETQGKPVVAAAVAAAE